MLQDNKTQITPSVSLYCSTYSGTTHKEETLDERGSRSKQLSLVCALAARQSKGRGAKVLQHVAGTAAISRDSVVDIMLVVVIITRLNL